MPNSLELNVSPALLHTFANHPFHVRKDMEMNELVDSIRESGVIVPLIVRTRSEGGYEIISGHRRCEACRELGIEKAPVRVQELTDDEATILMVNSNIQREHVLPSEKAFAYKMRMDAMKHQGRATSAQLGPKLSSEVLAEQVGESRNQIKRYIPIDAMSGASLKLMHHTGPWRSVHYLALGGTDYAALDAFLKYFPAVCKIALCLDNDNAGRTRTQDIIAHLEGSGKAVEDRPPPVGKDYNDTLVQYMQEYRAHCISMDDILEETR